MGSMAWMLGATVVALVFSYFVLQSSPQAGSDVFATAPLALIIAISVVGFLLLVLVLRKIWSFLNNPALEYNVDIEDEKFQENSLDSVSTDEDEEYNAIEKRYFERSKNDSSYTRKVFSHDLY